MRAQRRGEASRQLGHGASRSRYMVDNGGNVTLIEKSRPWLPTVSEETRP